MSRPPRIISKTGLYHIMFKGLNGQTLFEDDSDYEKMTDIISDIKEEKEFKVYAYALMSDHVHLFIHEREAGDIKKIMHKLLTRYAGYYNFKYTRSGPLIENRYKSEPIEDEVYYLSLVRYIHQNASDMTGYKWSSYKSYIDGDGIADTDDVLDMFSRDGEEAVKLFVEFHQDTEMTDFFISETKRLTDEQLKRKMRGVLGEEIEISKLPKKERDEKLAILRDNGFTIGELERITGISRSIVTRAGHKKDTKNSTNNRDISTYLL